jgi:hypothetical protein
MTADDLRKQLEETLDEAPWSWLRPHASRDGVILVQPGLDLLEAAVAVARNDGARVSAWIGEGKLVKPTADQLSAWEKTPERKFLCVVVQPYVLAQEHLLN